MSIENDRLKHLRAENHLKQSYLAYLLHVSPRAYSHYEDGSRHIPMDILVHLAGIYQVSTDYILGLTDDRRPYPPPVLFLAQTAEKKLRTKTASGFQLPLSPQS